MRTPEGISAARGKRFTSENVEEFFLASMNLKSQRLIIQSTG